MNKIWLKHYPQGVPEEIYPDSFQSINELLVSCCEQFHDQIAFSNFGVEMTYGEVDQKSQFFANYLRHTLGLQKGERVAIMLPNILQFPIAMFGALRAGLVVVNVNPLYTERELVHQLSDAGAKVVVVLANFASVLARALPETPVEKVIITELGDLLGGLKGQVVNFVVKHIKRMVPAYDLPGSIHFKKTLKIGATHEFSKIEITGNDIAFLQYTGGTTGVAKGAILTHRNIIANTLQCAAWGLAGGRDAKDVVVAPLPLYHIFSLTVCCFVFMRVGGTVILITNPRDINGFIKSLIGVEFTGFVGINTLFAALLNHPRFKELDFSKLQLVMSGGMALQRAVANDWQAATGNCIIEGYGLTETSPVVTINPLDTKQFTGSIGLPVSSTLVSIRDDNSKELGVGEEGELCVSGPQVMRGYWQHDEETKKVMCADGYLRTGDVARIDEDGMVYIVDRKKDMIVVSGFNVYPNEVEEVITMMPEVLEVAVIGVADSYSGEAIKAFIVKKDPRLTAIMVKQFCREQLTGYKRPRFIEFCDSLPKSNVGKILRRELRNKAPQQHEETTS